MLLDLIMLSPPLGGLPSLRKMLLPLANTVPEVLPPVSSWLLEQGKASRYAVGPRAWPPGPPPFRLMKAVMPEATEGQ
jgi:hypothetical protein